MAGGGFDLDHVGRAVSPVALLRQRMVAEQLAGRGIRDRRVLEAMSCVPREAFVPAEYRADAYSDTPLPIGYGQTISQPYTVAFQCEALELEGGETVLEVGTGSGYGAAVLSLLAREVHTIEYVEPLGSSARERLARLGYENVSVHLGDGSQGFPGAAPFHAIVVTAAADGIPTPYLDQLAEGGRLVIPVETGPAGETLYRVRRERCKLYVEDLGGFRFVPLVGKYGKRNELSPD
jgi:protein-L-isoaspartate(D-aspartate) O-methyltransferase